MLLSLLSFKLLAGTAKRQIRRYFVAGAILLTAGLCGLVAGVFILLAVYEGLLIVWSPPLAALGTAAVPAVLGAVLVVVARARLNRSAPRPVADRPGPALPTGDTGVAETPLLSKSQMKQAGMLAGALAIGIVVGLVRKRSHR